MKNSKESLDLLFLKGGKRTSLFKMHDLGDPFDSCGSRRLSRLLYLGMCLPGRPCCNAQSHKGPGRGGLLRLDPVLYSN